MYREINRQMEIDVPRDRQMEMDILRDRQTGSEDRYTER